MPYSAGSLNRNEILVKLLILLRVNLALLHQLDVIMSSNV